MCRFIIRIVWPAHYNNVIMGLMASQITSLTIVYSTVYSGADQGKHKTSASLAFVWGIHRPPVNPPHKGPVTRKMFRFDDVIMLSRYCLYWLRVVKCWALVTSARWMFYKGNLLCLCLNSSTPNLMIYGETATLPISCHIKTRMINLFWHLSNGRQSKWPCSTKYSRVPL